MLFHMNPSQTNKQTKRKITLLFIATSCFKPGTLLRSGWSLRCLSGIKCSKILNNIRI